MFNKQCSNSLCPASQPPIAPKPKPLPDRIISHPRHSLKPRPEILGFSVSRSNGKNAHQTGGLISNKDICLLRKTPGSKILEHWSFFNGDDEEDGREVAESGKCECGCVRSDGSEKKRTQKRGGTVCIPM